jgi:pilus assembly protein CpaD
MKKRLILPLLLSTVLSASCSIEDIRNYDPHYSHPSTVEKQTAVLTVSDVSKGQVSTIDEQNISEFVDAYNRQGEPPIAISIGGLNGSEPHVADKAGVLASELVKRGVRLQDIAFYVASGESPTLAQMSFSIYTIAPEDCGHWFTSSEMDMGNYISTNHGCAMQHNLDVMAANPADLYHSQPASGRSANRSYDVVTAYSAGDEVPGSDDLIDITITGTSE